MTIPKWMTSEEIEAELKPAGRTSLDDIRQKMIEESESPAAEARRHQEAIATSQFLQSPVTYSNERKQ